MNIVECNRSTCACARATAAQASRFRSAATNAMWSSLARCSEPGQDGVHGRSCGSRRIATGGISEYATYEKSRIDGTFVAAAQPLDGDVVQTLGNIARRHALMVVAGIVETSE